MNQSQQLESSVHARSKRNRRHDGKVGDFVHLCAAKIGQNREPTPTYNAVVLIVIEYLSTECVDSEMGCAVLQEPGPTVHGIGWEAHDGTCPSSVSPPHWVLLSLSVVHKHPNEAHLHRFISIQIGG